MATETSVQKFVHRLEGTWAKWVLLALLVVAIVAECFLWFFWNNGFKGLAHPAIIEQAQIAREVARGNGFSTKMIRPAALWQFQKHMGDIPPERVPDTYHAPLWPAVLAPFIGLMKDTWEMSPKEVLYPSDRVIAMLATFFFLLSVVVNYFLALRLFDQRLALLAGGLMLLCDRFWQYSMSGLPQMLMLFLFSCAAYAVFRAVQARDWQPYLDDVVPVVGELDGTLSPPPLPEAGAMSDDDAVYSGEVRRGLWQRPLPWLLTAAVLFALLALTHALTIWIFLGLLVFCGLAFRPFGRDAAIMLGVFLLLYSPWLVRTYLVSGDIGGVAWHSVLFQIRGTESSIMRSMNPPLEGVQPTYFREKIQGQTLAQLGNIYQYLGYVLVAPAFFIALLHLFRRRDTSHFRWCVLLMWLAALFGMSVFGLDTLPLKSNDLHVLFIPLMTFYGLAYVLVLWTRLEISLSLLRIAFITFIFLVSAMPFLGSLFDLLRPPRSKVQWPPYVPPYIAILGTWTKPNEVIASDMPWAVAWYADRTSLWVPTTIKEFIDLNDYNLMKGRIVGLYLTPISGNGMFLADVVKGEWKEWAPFVMRTANLKNFPLRAVQALPIENECIFYADRDRWTTREE